MARGDGWPCRRATTDSLLPPSAGRTVSRARVPTPLPRAAVHPRRPRLLPTQVSGGVTMHAFHFEIANVYNNLTNLILKLEPTDPSSAAAKVRRTSWPASVGSLSSRACLRRGLLRVQAAVSLCQLPLAMADRCTAQPSLTGAASQLALRLNARHHRRLGLRLHGCAAALGLRAALLPLLLRAGARRPGATKADKLTNSLSQAHPNARCSVHHA